MGNLKFTRHFYKVEKALKTYCVYSLVKTVSSKTKITRARTGPEKLLQILTDTLRIEKYNGYSKATGINFYLRLRTDSNWQRCQKVTGLRPTGRKLLFEGNLLDNGKKSLLLFDFNKETGGLIIDVYKDFYPYHKGQLKKIVNQHLNGY